MYIMLIRVFLYTTPIGPLAFWRDLGALYLSQLMKTGLDVCAVCLGPVSDLRDETSPVYKFPGAFLSRGRDPYVSFVIGYGENYKIHLCDAKKNIVLTASRPRPPKVEDMENLVKFDHILVPTVGELDELYRCGIAGYNKVPKVLSPKADALKEFFTREAFR